MCSMDQCLVTIAAKASAVVKSVLGHTNANTSIPEPLVGHLEESMSRVAVENWQRYPFFLGESDSSTSSQNVSGFFAFTSLMQSFNQPHNVPLVGFVRIVQSLENLHFFPATSNIHSHQAHPNKSPKTFRISHWALDSAAFFIISLERMIFNASNHPVKTIDSVDCFSLMVFFFCGRCRPDATKGSPSVLVSFALTTSIFSPNNSQPRK